jgi:hypothetical protein
MKAKIPNLTPQQRAQILGDPVPQPIPNACAEAINTPGGLHMLCASYPRRLISLRDMIEFLGRDFISLLSELEREGRVASEIAKQGAAPATANQEYVLRMGKFLGSLSNHCDTLCLTGSRTRIQHFIEYTLLGHFPDPAFQVIETEISGIYASILSELQRSKFAFIPARKWAFFEQAALFDEPFHRDASPEINVEVKAAGNCLAADLNTAAVFHLIRAAEFGLREFVTHLKADKRLPKQLEEWDWHELIDAADDAIKKIIAIKFKNRKREERRKKAVKGYQTALSEFRILKDVWRNNVMHTRGAYTEHGAMDVYCRVRDFLPRLQKYLKDS